MTRTRLWRWRLHLKELRIPFFVPVRRMITSRLRCTRSLTTVTKIQIGRYGTTSETFRYKATLHRRMASLKFVFFTVWIFAWTTLVVARAEQSAPRLNLCEDHASSPVGRADELFVEKGPLEKCPHFVDLQRLWSLPVSWPFCHAKIDTKSSYQNVMNINLPAVLLNK